MGYKDVQENCSYCSGTGKVRCSSCNGSGVDLLLWFCSYHHKAVDFSHPAPKGRDRGCCPVGTYSL